MHSIGYGEAKTGEGSFFLACRTTPFPSRTAPRFDQPSPTSRGCAASGGEGKRLPSLP
jgi:hypothetical protein